MKRNRIMWVVVVFFVSTTIAVTLNEPSGLTKGTGIAPSPTPPSPTITNLDDPRFSKYGVADYGAAAESVQSPDVEQRKRINQRYDRQGWVQKNPHPETGKIGRITEEELPEVLPGEESDLIVSGKVVSVATYLSNDKTGVYSEFKIKVDQSLKRRAGIKLEQKHFITIDRAGGVVRYPNSQEVLYLDGVKGLPEVGREYVFFLKADDESENFPILTAFELLETETIPLDLGRSMEDLKRLGKSNFINLVKSKLSPQKEDE